MHELNAALHFIKFVKRSRNLAVTDPQFNATLENTMCGEYESLGHIIQTCARTRALRKKRHDVLVDMVEQLLRKNGYEVQQEPNIPTPVISTLHIVKHRSVVTRRLHGRPASVSNCKLFKSAKQCPKECVQKISTISLTSDRGRHIPLHTGFKQQTYDYAAAVACRQWELTPA